jgi:hypothetical protein
LEGLKPVIRSRSNAEANAVKTISQKHAQMETQPCMEIRSLGSAELAPRREHQYRVRLGSSWVEIVDEIRDRIGSEMF